MTRVLDSCWYVLVCVYHDSLFKAFSYKSYRLKDFPLIKINDCVVAANIGSFKVQYAVI